MMVMVIAMAAVAAMAPMHKEMQRRAQEQQGIRQDAEEMSRMLCDQEKGGDSQKGQQHQTRARPEKLFG